MPVTKENRAGISHRIDVQYASAMQGIPGKRQIRCWAAAGLEAREEAAELTVRIVDEAESAALNGRWRGIDRPTNVLSFPAGGNPVMPQLLGDVVICAPVVAREAVEQGKPAEAHWAHMVIHGVLHLQGYDHIEARDAAVMEPLEIRKLKELDYPNPYA